MPVISASVDVFVATSLALLVPLTIFLRRHRQSTSNYYESPIRRYLTPLVILHTLYILYTISVLWPPNLFTALDLPLTTPSETIRAVLSRKAGLMDEYGLSNDAGLPKALEGLLTRLSSFEMRVLYIRFGQTVIQDCTHCSSFEEYALYALPGPLLQYVREAFLIGLLTIRGSFRERWRLYAVGALAVSAAFEAYYVGTSSVKVPKDGRGVFMLHDNLWFIRNLIFLFLPLLIHLLPPSPPASYAIPSPTSPTPQNIPTLLMNTSLSIQTTLERLTSLKYMHGAIMRDPTLHKASSDWWEKQKRWGEIVRGDPRVQEAAEKSGFGFVDELAAPVVVEGEEVQGGAVLKRNARAAANMLVKAATSGVSSNGGPLQS